MKVFDENLVAVMLKPERVYIDKPILVGASILDVSKKLMAEFHYDFALPTFGHSNVSLIYTDTDSLFYQIRKVKDIFQALQPHRHLFDFSNFQQTHYLHNKDSQNVRGLMKIETADVHVQEIVALRPKCYSVK